MPKAPSGGSGTATTPLGFTGQLTDSESGLVDLRARLYDPSTGQFLSRDTYAGTPANPLSLNLYSYGANDPTHLTGPSGHNPIPGYFDSAAAIACAVGGPALANEVRIFQVLSSIAIGFIPGVGDAYFLLSAFAGEDLITGTKLSESEREWYAGMAALSLATMIVGAGVFSQEAVAASRTVEELGQLERVGSELAHGAETELRAAEDVGHVAEGAARDVSDAGAVGRDVSAGADVAASAARTAAGPTQRFVADTGIFADRVESALQRQYADAILHDPDVKLYVPDAVERELSQSPSLSQAERLKGYPGGAQIERVADPSLAGIDLSKALRGKFNEADAYINQAAADRGIPVLTTNGAMVNQFADTTQGPGAVWKASNVWVLPGGMVRPQLPGPLLP